MDQLIALEIDQSTVGSLDTSGIRSFLRETPANAKTLRSLRGRCALLFSAYDNDPREVWQIPEARRYVQKVDAEIPHLLYFLVPHTQAGQFVLWLSCMLPYKVVDNGGNFDLSSAPALLEIRRQAIRNFCIRSGDNYQEAIQLVMTGVPDDLRWVWATNV